MTLKNVTRNLHQVYLWMTCALCSFIKASLEWFLLQRFHPVLKDAISQIPHLLSIDIFSISFQKYAYNYGHHVLQLNTLTNGLSQIHCHQYIKSLIYQHIVEFVLASLNATDCHLVITKMFPHLQSNKHLLNTFQPNGPVNTAYIWLMQVRIKWNELDFLIPQDG